MALMIPFHNKGWVKGRQVNREVQRSVKQFGFEYFLPMFLR